jgi:MSHA pilin protein MshC
VARGFTLIELIVLMVLLGVLSVFLLPTLKPDDFATRGFRDETTALLRFAQKTAVAQRRMVCVSVQATGLRLQVDAASPPSGACAQALQAPSRLQGGQGLSSSVSNFHFTPLGGTNQASNITLSLAGLQPIVVEASSGYVHD